MGVAAVSSSAGGVGIGGDGGEGHQQEEWEHPSLEKREWRSVYVPQTILTPFEGGLVF